MATSTRADREVRRVLLAQSSDWTRFAHALTVVAVPFGRDGEDGDLRVSFDHLGANGFVYEEGEEIDGWEDFEDGLPAVEAALSALGEVEAPPSCQKAIRVQEKGGRVLWQGISKVAHRRTANGDPACGAKLSFEEKNEARRDPWNRCAVPADERRSVWLPSFKAPDCKACAKRPG